MLGVASGILGLLLGGGFGGEDPAKPQDLPREPGPLLASLSEVSWSIAYAEGNTGLLDPSLGATRGVVGPLAGYEVAFLGRRAIAFDLDHFLVVGGQLFLAQYDHKAFGGGPQSVNPGPPPVVAQDGFRFETKTWGVFATAGAMASVSNRVVFLLAEAGPGAVSAHAELRTIPSAPGTAGRIASERQWFPALRFAMTLGLNVPGTRLRGAIPRILDPEEEDEAGRRNTRPRTVFGFRFTAAYTAAPSYDADFQDGAAAMRFNPSYYSLGVALTIVW